MGEAWSSEQLAAMREQLNEVLDALRGDGVSAPGEAGVPSDLKPSSESHDVAQAIAAALAHAGGKSPIDTDGVQRVGEVLRELLSVYRASSDNRARTAIRDQVHAFLSRLVRDVVAADQVRLLAPIVQVVARVLSGTELLAGHALGEAVERLQRGRRETERTDETEHPLLNRVLSRADQALALAATQAFDVALPSIAEDFLADVDHRTAHAQNFLLNQFAPFLALNDRLHAFDGRFGALSNLFGEADGESTLFPMLAHAFGLETAVGVGAWAEDGEEGIDLDYLFGSSSLGGDPLGGEFAPLEWADAGAGAFAPLPQMGSPSGFRPAAGYARPAASWGSSVRRRPSRPSTYGRTSSYASPAMGRSSVGAWPRAAALSFPTLSPVAPAAFMPRASMARASRMWSAPSSSAGLSRRLGRMHAPDLLRSRVPGAFTGLSSSFVPSYPSAMAHGTLAHGTLGRGTLGHGGIAASLSPRRVRALRQLLQRSGGLGSLGHVALGYQGLARAGAQRTSMEHLARIARGGRSRGAGLFSLPQLSRPSLPRSMATRSQRRSAAATGLGSSVRLTRRGLFGVPQFAGSYPLPARAAAMVARGGGHVAVHAARNASSPQPFAPRSRAVGYTVDDFGITRVRRVPGVGTALAFEPAAAVVGGGVAHSASTQTPRGVSATSAAPVATLRAAGPHYQWSAHAAAQTQTRDPRGTQRGVGSRAAARGIGVQALAHRVPGRRVVGPAVYGGRGQVVAGPGVRGYAAQTGQPTWQPTFSDQVVAPFSAAPGRSAERFVGATPRALQLAGQPWARPRNLNKYYQQPTSPRSAIGATCQFVLPSFATSQRAGVASRAVSTDLDFAPAGLTRLIDPPPVSGPWIAPGQQLRSATSAVQAGERVFQQADGAQVTYAAAGMGASAASQRQQVDGQTVFSTTAGRQPASGSAQDLRLRARHVAAGQAASPALFVRAGGYSQCFDASGYAPVRSVGQAQARLWAFSSGLGREHVARPDYRASTRGSAPAQQQFTAGGTPRTVLGSVQPLRDWSQLQATGQVVRPRLSFGTTELGAQGYDFSGFAVMGPAPVVASGAGAAAAWHWPGVGASRAPFAPTQVTMGPAGVAAPRLSAIYGPQARLFARTAHQPSTQQSSTLALFADYGPRPVDQFPIGFLGGLGFAAGSATQAASPLMSTPPSRSAADPLQRLLGALHQRSGASARVSGRQHFAMKTLRRRNRFRLDGWLDRPSARGSSADHLAAAGQAPSYVGGGAASVPFDLIAALTGLRDAIEHRSHKQPQALRALENNFRIPLQASAHSPSFSDAGAVTIRTSAGEQVRVVTQGSTPIGRGFGARSASQRQGGIGFVSSMRPGAHSNVAGAGAVYAGSGRRVAARLPQTRSGHPMVRSHMAANLTRRAARSGKPLAIGSTWTMASSALPLLPVTDVIYNTPQTRFHSPSTGFVPTASSSGAFKPNPGLPMPLLAFMRSLVEGAAPRRETATPYASTGPVKRRAPQKLAQALRAVRPSTDAGVSEVAREFVSARMDREQNLHGDLRRFAVEQQREEKRVARIIERQVLRSVREPVQGFAPKLGMTTTGNVAEAGEALVPAGMDMSQAPIHRKARMGFASDVAVQAGKSRDQFQPMLEKTRRPVPPVPDLNQLIYQVYNKIKREMAIDLERRGGGF